MITYCSENIYGTVGQESYITKIDVNQSGFIATVFAKSSFEFFQNDCNVRFFSEHVFSSFQNVLTARFSFFKNFKKSAQNLEEMVKNVKAKNIAFVELHKVIGKNSCGHTNTLFMHMHKSETFFRAFC